MTASDTAPKLRVSGLSIGLIVLAIAIQISPAARAGATICDVNKHVTYGSCNCPSGSTLRTTLNGQLVSNEITCLSHKCDAICLQGGTSTASDPSSSKHTSPNSGSGPKCESGRDPGQCVSLEQRGKSGRWHNYRLVNSCNTRFKVKVFACAANWAGGCKIEEETVGPCETTGSGSEGKQSWDKDAQLSH